MAVLGNKNVLGAIALVAGFLSSSSQAGVYYLDTFAIAENDTIIFLDDFNDDSPPDTSETPAPVDVNVYDLGYQTFLGHGDQLPGPEADGKLAMDSEVGPIIESEVFPGVFGRVQGANVLSSLNPADDSALITGERVAVAALFDLVIPDPGDSYRIRVSDADSRVEIGLITNSLGITTVRFRQGASGAGFTNLETWLLSAYDLTGFEQIAFLLDNLLLDGISDSFFGAWGLYDIETSTVSNPETGAANDFLFSSARSEALGPAVRGSFLMFASAEPVPVPATLLLLALGLAAMSYRTKQN